MTIHLLLVWGPFLMALGALVGFMSGLLGLGGGILLVPSLFYSMKMLGFPPEHLMHVAVGTSLAVIVPTSLSSARAHWRRGSVRMDLVKKIGVGVVLGVALGTVLAGHLSSDGLKAVFAVMLAVISLVIIIDPARFTLMDDVPPQPWSAMVGAAIGALSALMGIGGATVTIPYMTLCRVPMKQAVGTASALSLMVALVAVAGFLSSGHGYDHLPPFSFGYMNVLAVSLIAPFSVMTAPFGAHVAHNVPVKFLRRVFAVFLIVVSVKMMMDVLYG